MDGLGSKVLLNSEKTNLKKGQSITLDEALHLSLTLAQKGQGRVEPNPCVGAVLFDPKKNELISWGYHEFYGGAHAELNCLKDIEDASGLSLVVSLEPCSHYGKTPPCADLVVAKKVSKLIYIQKDPNPLVSGKGLERISSVGVEVVEASKEFKDLHQILNDKFLFSFKNKRSYVHLKWAQSKNAKLGRVGESTSITSSESQMDAHYLRAQSQMIVVGVDTILQDDPKLNVRLKGYEKDLMVGVLDPDLKLINELQTKNIFNIRPKGTVFLITHQNVEHPNVICIKKINDSQLDLKNLCERVYADYAVQSIFVEGGAKTLKSFIDQDVFNQVSIYESDKNLEGEKSLSVFETRENQKNFIEEKLVLRDKKAIGKNTLKSYLKS